MEKLFWNLRQKIIWTITILLLVGHLILQYTFIKQYDFSDDIGLFSFIVDLISNICIAFAVGAIFGALTALIPFRQKKYGQKFKTTFPISTSLTLVVIIISFGYVAYLEKVKGITIHPFVKYDSVEIPNGLDCSSIKNGKFETDKLLIERQDDIQSQTTKDTNKKTDYKVEWLSDCEYYLSPLDNQTKKIKVKITFVAVDHYNCYVVSDKDLTNYAAPYTIKIRKIGN